MKLVRMLASTFLFAALAAGVSPALHAHEGHAALPSTGVTLDGNQLLISPAAIEAIGMETATIRLGDVEHTLHVNAHVELPWSGQAKVSTLADGKIEQVLVRPGQKVTKHKELARVQSLELDTLQAKLLQSAAEIAMLQRLNQKRREFADALEGSQLRESLTDEQQARAEFAIHYRKLAALGLDDATLRRVLDTGETVSSLPVVSPIDGYVAHADARPGELVAAADHLFDIVDASTVLVVGQVPEGDAYLVRDGLPVRMSFAGLPEEISGVVRHINLKLDLTKRSLEVIVEVDNRDALLRSGMFGRMAIQIAAAKQQIVCPHSALIETEHGVFVLRRDSEGKFSRQPVKVGMRTPKFAVADSGLFPGQQVITRGAQLLAAMYDANGPAEPSVAQPATMSSAASPDAPWTLVRAARATVEMPTGEKAVATSLLEGRIVSISAHPGKQVTAGEPLAEMESQQLRDLELELLQAAGKLRWAQVEAERLKPLAQAGNASLRDLWQRELDVKILTQQITSLDHRLTRIGLPQETIEQLRSEELSDVGGGAEISGRVAIDAPISGRVAEMGLMLGQLVHAHDNLLEIQHTDIVWVRALFLEDDAPRIESGQQAAVTFPSHPGLRLNGKVLRLSPVLVSRERVLPVWIEVANADGFLREDMLAEVEIRVPKRPAAVAGARDPNE